jgi:hypothetical protein
VLTEETPAPPPKRAGPILPAKIGAQTHKDLKIARGVAGKADD